MNNYPMYDIPSPSVHHRYSATLLIRVFFVLFKYRLILTLKIEGCHDANFFVSSDIDRSLRWCQWWQCWHHDNSRFTVYCDNSICEEYSHPQMTPGNVHLVWIFLYWRISGHFLWKLIVGAKRFRNWTTGPRFNTKIKPYQYRISHCGDLTTVLSPQWDFLYW